LKIYASTNPDEANPYDSMGDIYFGMGKLDEAISSYNKALEIKPGFNSFLKMAIIYTIKEEYDTALELLQEQSFADYSIRNKIFFYFGIVMSNLILGKYVESIKYLDKALELAKQVGAKFWEAYGNWTKGWIYYDKGKLDKSLSYFTAYHNIKLNLVKNELPDEAYYNFYKGILNIKRGKIDSAKNNLNGIHSLLSQFNDPDKSKLIYHYKLLYGEILIEEDSLNKAEEVYKTLPEIGHIDINSRTMFQDISAPFPKDGLARVFAKQGKIEKAIEEYEKLTSADPLERDLQFVKPVYHYRLAKLYEEKRLTHKSIKEYEKFLEILKDADKDIPELIDAKKRYKKLLGTN